MKKKIVFLLMFFLFVITPVKAVFAESVCKIGSTEYSKISACISNATDNTQTTIVLLLDRSENITIPTNKNIILDLNGYTLSNSGTTNKSNVITNNGTLEIKNGNITSIAPTGAINNNKDAVITITSGNYTATDTRQVLYNNGGTATISGGNLTSDTSERATVHNLNNGVLNGIGGKIVSNNAYAVYNEKGTLNIGTLNGIYNKSTPVIQGNTYGVIAKNNYNIYDGIIKGGTYHVGIAAGSPMTITDDEGETKVDDIEDFSEKELGEEIIGGTTYSTLTYDLDPSTIATITFDPVGGEVTPTYKKIIIGNSIGSLPTPQKINNTFDGWFTSSTGGDKITSSTKLSSNVTYYAHWTYVDPNTVASVEGYSGTMSLEDAFALGGKITLLKDVIVPSSLVMDKKTTLDLNGHTISLDNNTTTINNDVVIKDSTSSKNGLITSKNDFTVIVSSTGSLTHKGGTIEGLGDYGAVRNQGTLEIDGGTVTNTSDMYAILNENDLVMKSGTVYSSGGTAIQVSFDSTFEMNGGLVKTDAENEQAINLSANSIATINGGKVEAINTNGAGIGTFGYSTLVVNDGTIKGYDMAIAGNGNEYNGNVSITINGGDIIATDGVAMYLPQRNSTTIINGGNISGPSAIEIRAGDLIINDGIITATSDTYSIIPNSNGTTSKGTALAVVQHTSKQPIRVVINGGEFEAKAPVVEANPMENPQEAIDKVLITIKQGDFVSTGDNSVYAENPETLLQLVSGGTYTYDPSYYVKDGYGVVILPNNEYEVTKIHNITIDSDSTDLISVEKNEYPYKSTVEIKMKKKGLAIEVKDSKGNSIDVNGNTFTMPDDDVTIKAYYKTIINPITGDNILFYISTLGLSIICLISVKFILRKKLNNN